MNRREVLIALAALGACPLSSLKARNGYERMTFPAAGEDWGTVTHALLPDGTAVSFSSIPQFPEEAWVALDDPAVRAIWEDILPRLAEAARRTEEETFRFVLGAPLEIKLWP